MVKENELRLGNLVYARTFFQDDSAKEIVEVREILEGGINGESGYYGDYSPEYYFDCISGIPITKDVLIRCGGELIGEAKTHKGYSINDLIVMLFPECVMIDLGQFNVKCKYFHQLQNLYFALTGEELTIKQ